MYLVIKFVLVIGKVSRILLNPFKRPNDLSLIIREDEFRCILFQFPLNVHYLEKESLYILFIISTNKFVNTITVLLLVFIIDIEVNYKQ